MEGLDFNEILFNFRDAANDILREDRKLKELIDEVQDKLEDEAMFDDIIDDLYLSIDLLNDWRLGRYTNVSKESIILIVACLIYIINPMDIVPDMLKKLGFVGDLAAFLYMLKVIKDELDLYRQSRGNELLANESQEMSEFIELTTSKELVEVDDSEENIFAEGEI